jgi:hypothetical protein
MLNRSLKDQMHKKCRMAKGGEVHTRRSREDSSEDNRWIQSAINPSNKGALHRELKVPMGEKIPEKKLAKAEHSRDPSIRRRAVLAATLRSFKHKK